MDSFDFDNETKYKKKAIKKHKDKADHRHHYEKCIGRCEYHNTVIYEAIKVCTICGKMKHDKDILFYEDKNHRILTTLEEIKKYYPNYEVRDFRFDWWKWSNL